MIHQGKRNDPIAHDLTVDVDAPAPPKASPGKRNKSPEETDDDQRREWQSFWLRWAEACASGKTSLPHAQLIRSRITPRDYDRLLSNITVHTGQRVALARMGISAATGWHQGRLHAVFRDKAPTAEQVVHEAVHGLQYLSTTQRWKNHDSAVWPLHPLAVSHDAAERQADHAVLNVQRGHAISVSQLSTPSAAVHFDRDGRWARSSQLDKDNDDGKSRRQKRRRRRKQRKSRRAAPTGNIVADGVSRPASATNSHELQTLGNRALAGLPTVKATEPYQPAPASIPPPTSMAPAVDNQITTIPTPLPTSLSGDLQSKRLEVAQSIRNLGHQRRERMAQQIVARREEIAQIAQRAYEHTQAKSSEQQQAALDDGEKTIAAVQELFITTRKLVMDTAIQRRCELESAADEIAENLGEERCLYGDESQHALDIVAGEYADDSDKKQQRVNNALTRAHDVHLADLLARDHTLEGELRADQNAAGDSIITSAHAYIKNLDDKESEISVGIRTAAQATASAIADAADFDLIHREQHQLEAQLGDLQAQLTIYTEAAESAARGILGTADKTRDTQTETVTAEEMARRLDAAPIRFAEGLDTVDVQLGHALQAIETTWIHNCVVVFENIAVDLRNTTLSTYRDVVEQALCDEEEALRKADEGWRTIVEGYFQRLVDNANTGLATWHKLHVKTLQSYDKIAAKAASATFWWWSPEVAGEFLRGLATIVVSAAAVAAAVVVALAVSGMLAPLALLVGGIAVLVKTLFIAALAVVGVIMLIRALCQTIPERLRDARAHKKVADQPKSIRRRQLLWRAPVAVLTGVIDAIGIISVSEAALDHNVISGRQLSLPEARTKATGGLLTLASVGAGYGAFRWSSRPRTVFQETLVVESSGQLVRHQHSYIWNPRTKTVTTEVSATLDSRPLPALEGPAVASARSSPAPPPKGRIVYDHKAGTQSLELGSIPDGKVVARLSESGMRPLTGGQKVKVADYVAAAQGRIANAKTRPLGQGLKALWSEADALRSQRAHTSKVSGQPAPVAAQSPAGVLALPSGGQPMPPLRPKNTRVPDSRALAPYDPIAAELPASDRVSYLHHERVVQRGQVEGARSPITANFVSPRVMSALRERFGVEVAWLELQDGTHCLQMGGIDAVGHYIQLPANTRRVISHTHPSGITKLSRPDARIIGQLQRSTSVVTPEGSTRLSIPGATGSRSLATSGIDAPGRQVSRRIRDVDEPANSDASRGGKIKERPADDIFRNTSERRAKQPRPDENSSVDVAEFGEIPSKPLRRQAIEIYAPEASRFADLPSRAIEDLVNAVYATSLDIQTIYFKTTEQREVELTRNDDRFVAIPSTFDDVDVREFLDLEFRSELPNGVLVIRASNRSSFANVDKETLTRFVALRFGDIGVNSAELRIYSDETEISDDKVLDPGGNTATPIRVLTVDRASIGNIAASLLRERLGPPNPNSEADRDAFARFERRVETTTQTFTLPVADIEVIRNVSHIFISVPSSDRFASLTGRELQPFVDTLFPENTSSGGSEIAEVTIEISFPDRKENRPVDFSEIQTRRARSASRATTSRDVAGFSMLPIEEVSFTQASRPEFPLPSNLRDIRDTGIGTIERKILVITVPSSSPFSRLSDNQLQRLVNQAFVYGQYSQFYIYRGQAGGPIYDVTRAQASLAEKQAEQSGEPTLSDPTVQEALEKVTIEQNGNDTIVKLQVPPASRLARLDRVDILTVLADNYPDATEFIVDDGNRLRFKLSEVEQLVALGARAQPQVALEAAQVDFAAFPTSNISGSGDQPGRLQIRIPASSPYTTLGIEELIDLVATIYPERVDDKIDILLGSRRVEIPRPELERAIANRNLARVRNNSFLLRADLRRKDAEFLPDVQLVEANRVRVGSLLRFDILPTSPLAVLPPDELKELLRRKFGDSANFIEIRVRGETLTRVDGRQQTPAVRLEMQEPQIPLYPPDNEDLEAAGQGFVQRLQEALAARARGEQPEDVGYNAALTDYAGQTTPQYSRLRQGRVGEFLTQVLADPATRSALETVIANQERLVYTTGQSRTAIDAKARKLWVALSANNALRPRLIKAILAEMQDRSVRLAAAIDATPEVKPYWATVVVGASVQAAQYTNGLADVTNNPSVLMLDPGQLGDDDPLELGTFGASGETFRINSSNRAENGDIPGPGQGNLNPFQDAPVGVPDVAAGKWPAASAVGDVSTIGVYASGADFLRDSFVTWRRQDPDEVERWPGKYQVTLASGRLVYTDRIIGSIGLGDDKLPFDDASVELISEERAKIDYAKPTEVPGILTIGDALRIAARSDAPLDPYRSPDGQAFGTAIIGFGDTGRVEAEFLFRLAPEAAYDGKPGQIDKAQLGETGQVVWFVGPSGPKDCVEYVQTQRARYVPVSTAIKSERITTVQDFAVSIARSPDGRFIVTDGKGESRTFDRVVIGTGFEDGLAKAFGGPGIETQPDIRPVRGSNDAFTISSNRDAPIVQVTRRGAQFGRTTLFSRDRTSEATARRLIDDLPNAIAVLEDLVNGADEDLDAVRAGNYTSAKSPLVKLLTTADSQQSVSVRRDSTRFELRFELDSGTDLRTRIADALERARNDQARIRRTLVREVVTGRLGSQPATFAVSNDATALQLEVTSTGARLGSVQLLGTSTTSRDTAQRLLDDLPNAVAVLENLQALSADDATRIKEGKYRTEGGSTVRTGTLEGGEIGIAIKRDRSKFELFFPVGNSANLRQPLRDALQSARAVQARIAPGFLRQTSANPDGNTVNLATKLPGEDIYFVGPAAGPDIISADDPSIANITQNLQSIFIRGPRTAQLARQLGQDVGRAVRFTPISPLPETLPLADGTSGNANTSTRIALPEIRRAIDAFGGSFDLRYGLAWVLRSFEVPGADDSQIRFEIMPERDSSGPGFVLRSTTLSAEALDRIAAHIMKQTDLANALATFGRRQVLDISFDIATDGRIRTDTLRISQ